MIRLEHVTHHYGIRPVLRDISLEIASGELVAVVGPNGMGKSTLLKLMAGLLAPVRGTVEIAGLVRRASEATELLIRQRVAFLADQPYLRKDFSGREMILAVGRIYEISDDELFERADRLLSLFDLHERADQPLSGYSNGQRKKLSIVAVLIAHTPVLLLDEPFGGGLDPAGILALKALLTSRQQRDGTTIVLSAPVPELLEGFATRILAIREGTIAAFDTPENLRQQAGGNVTLAEALTQLVFPTAQQRIDEYLR